MFGGWQEWLIILLIVGLIFGTSKLKNMGSDLGGAVKGFKKGLKEDESKEKDLEGSKDKVNDPETGLDELKDKED